MSLCFEMCLEQELIRINQLETKPSHVCMNIWIKEELKHFNKLWFSVMMDSLEFFSNWVVMVYGKNDVLQ